MIKFTNALLRISKPLFRKSAFCLQTSRQSNIHFYAPKLSSYKKDVEPLPQDMVAREQFFDEIVAKDKRMFLKAVASFNATDRLKRGHIEFIYAALKYMEEFGVIYELEAYKKLMDVFPKGKMIPKNLIQAEFYHFSRHQDCALFLMDQMDYHCVIPDREMGDIIVATFGKSSHVYKKFARMMYWMPKLKNIEPFLLPNPLPSDIRELARLALQKMCVDNRTKIADYEAKELEDSVDKTWILSAQSPEQHKLIEKHSLEKSLFIEGPHLVWLKKLSISYFVLMADPEGYETKFEEEDHDDVSNLLFTILGDKKPSNLTLKPTSIHQQEEGIVMGMCCTGTSSKDSLLSWIRFLKNTNPRFDRIPVLFKLRSSPTSVISVNSGQESLRFEEEASESPETVS